MIPIFGSQDRLLLFLRRLQFFVLIHFLDVDTTHMHEGERLSNDPIRCFVWLSLLLSSRSILFMLLTEFYSVSLFVLLAVYF